MGLVCSGCELCGGLCGVWRFCVVWYSMIWFFSSVGVAVMVVVTRHGDGRDSVGTMWW